MIAERWADSRPGAQADIGPAEGHRAAQVARALRSLRFEEGRVRLAEGPGRTPADERHADARILYEEGRGQLAAGRRVLPLELFAAAVVSAPYLADAYAHLGRGLRVLGRIDEALAAYSTALDLDVFAQTVRPAAVFTDGFESGDTSAW